MTARLLRSIVADIAGDKEAAERVELVLMSYALAGVLITLYGIVVWLDSSSLTAGTAGTAEPSQRGATLAVHSMLGYAGGFVGPLLMAGRSICPAACRKSGGGYRSSRWQR